MSNRACPLCFVKLSRVQVVTLSKDLVCPGCHVTLRLSLLSRLLGSFAGIVVAGFVYRLAQPQDFSAGWIISTFVTVFAFVASSALVLFLFSDLVVHQQPESSVFPHPTR
jgi:hypothetical protein